MGWLLVDGAFQEGRSARARTAEACPPGWAASSQFICDATMGSCSAVCQGSSGHQRSKAGRLRWLEALARLRRNADGYPGPFRRHEHSLRGLRPPVVREAEERPVHRQHHSASHQPVGGDRLLGPEVPVGPGGPVFARLDHRHVERAPAARRCPSSRGTGPCPPRSTRDAWGRAAHSWPTASRRCR